MSSTALKNFLARWVIWSWSQGRWVLVTILLLTVIFAVYAERHFQMNSRFGDLIEQNAQWKSDWNDYKAAFPELIETVVVVVSSSSRGEADQLTRRLNTAFHSQPDKYSSVYAPAVDDFLRDRALLYLNVDQLADITDSLAEAQPILTKVAEDPSMRGVLELVIDGVENEPPDGFARILQILADATEEFNATVKHSDVSHKLWADEFFADVDRYYSLIVLKGPQHFGDRLPNSALLANIRAEIATLRPSGDTRIQLTGEVALSHEEVSAALKGVKKAGVISALLLLVILGLGVRSIRIIGACALMLVVGIVWTGAFALATVGTFNTLSVLFLVMFLGLGVDFALHFCLRFAEALHLGETPQRALTHSTDSVGGAISLCTLTTAVGFMAFIPTDYQGLADLGLVSAGGMLIAGIMTFTLLPAFFRAFGLPDAHRAVDFFASDVLIKRLRAKRNSVIAVVVVLTLGAGIFAARMYFDYSVLALRDPESESMSTLIELSEAGEITDYSMALMTEQADDPTLTAIKALPSVESLRSPKDYLPKNADDKLLLLEELSDILWSALEPSRQLPPPNEGELRSLVRRSSEALGTELATPTLNREASRLASALTQLQSDAQIAAWQAAVMGDLTSQLEWLRRAVTAEVPVFNELPAALRERIVGRDGRYQHMIEPGENIIDVRSLAEFVESVRAINPNATGRPVVEWGVGQIVVTAFKEAMTYALIAIVIILLLALPSVKYTAMVLLPLLLTVVFTVAIAVMIDMPFNMANILVLPLIFGLGVDNGIHVVDRFHNEGDVAHLIHSSTPRAVLLSTLTTIGTFASLSLSPHVGTASIGILLTIAVGFILLFSIFLLPVLLDTGNSNDN